MSGYLSTREALQVAAEIHRKAVTIEQIAGSLSLAAERYIDALEELDELRDRMLNMAERLTLECGTEGDEK